MLPSWFSSAVQKLADAHGGARALQALFTERVQRYLHVVLCVSPQSPTFPVRAQRFPGIMSNCTIDFFSPWPVHALLSVADGTVKSMRLLCTPEVGQAVVKFLADTHATVRRVLAYVCDDAGVAQVPQMGRIALLSVVLLCHRYWCRFVYLIVKSLIQLSALCCMPSPVLSARRSIFI